MTVPEIRRIDPDAEAARLAADRKRDAHILCDEEHVIRCEGETGFVRIRVTSSLAPLVRPVTLGYALRQVVADQCYPPSEPGDA